MAGQNLPISITAMVKLTSTTSPQTITIPGNGGTMLAYNAGANIVYLAEGSTVALPTIGVFSADLIPVAPGSTQVFSIPSAELPMSYIAETAGGTLILAVGTGY